MIIAIYVLNNFDRMFVTAEELLKGAEGSNNIFSKRLSSILLIISFVVILERYISRANVREKIKSKGIGVEDDTAFKSETEKVFLRTST